MQRKTSRISELVRAGVLILVTIGSISAQQSEEIAPTAGSFDYLGGTAKARRAATRTTAQTFAAIGLWTPLTNGSLTYTITQNTDTFSVSFSGKCAKLNGGQLRIRIQHTNPQGVVNFAEPYDGGQAFCTAAGPATYTGKWIPRGTLVGSPGVLTVGTHTLQVQFLNSGGGAGTIDDWLFELVVYD